MDLTLPDLIRGSDKESLSSLNVWTGKGGKAILGMIPIKTCSDWRFTLFEADENSFFGPDGTCCDSVEVHRSLRFEGTFSIRAWDNSNPAFQIAMDKFSRYRKECGESVTFPVIHLGEPRIIFRLVARELAQRDKKATR